MQVVSLHTKLRNLLDSGILAMRSDPDLGHVFRGEGSYYLNQDKVEILADYKGPAPDGGEVTFEVPHDVAWIPRTKTMLAYAQADTGPFELMPEAVRTMMSAFKNKKRSSLQ
jgi:hypothetical protein